MAIKCVKVVEGGQRLDALRKNMKNFSRDNRFPYRDSTRALHNASQTQYSWSNLLYSVA